MRILIHTLIFFLLVTQLCFAQWTQVGLNGKSIKDIAVQNSTIFAITSDSGSVFRSVDNGANWAMIVDSCARDVAISQTGKIFMVRDTSLYYSLDNGNTWVWINILEQLADSLWDWQFSTPENITVSPLGILFCGIQSPDGTWGILRSFGKSTDDGLTWTTPGLGILGGENFDFKNQFVLTVGGQYDFYHTEMYVHLSTDYGNTWIYMGAPVTCLFHALSFFSNDNIIVAGSVYVTGYPNATHISTDMCNTWTQISTLNSQVGLSWSNGLLEGMLIGTDIGVFLFSDEGDSLGSRNEGLTNLNIQTLTLDNNGYVYAGTGNGVWQRPLGEVTAVEENQIENPSSYNLSQNFPNPFNPSTKIKYSIQQSSNVVIKVYDVLGNEIETLVSEEKSFGTYELTWHAANLPSGVYFYQLRAGNFVETKKMVLLR